MNARELEAIYTGTTLNENTFIYIVSKTFASEAPRVRRDKSTSFTLDVGEFCPDIKDLSCMEGDHDDLNEAAQSQGGENELFC